MSLFGRLFGRKAPDLAAIAAAAGSTDASVEDEVASGTVRGFRFTVTLVDDHVSIRIAHAPLPSKFVVQFVPEAPDQPARAVEGHAAFDELPSDLRERVLFELRTNQICILTARRDELSILTSAKTDAGRALAFGIEVVLARGAKPGEATAKELTADETRALARSIGARIPGAVLERFDDEERIEIQWAVDGIDVAILLDYGCGDCDVRAGVPGLTATRDLDGTAGEIGLGFLELDDEALYGNFDELCAIGDGQSVIEAATRLAAVAKQLRSIASSNESA